MDSFFTALDHGDGDGRDERGPIDEFFFVGGFDLRLGASEGIKRVLSSLTEVAAALGHPLHFVRTNLREPETRWNRLVNWGLVGNGPALASVPLAFGARYDRALIPASNLYSSPSPWGSHPLTDSLLSSWTLRVRDDGAAHDRPDKTRAVASSELARRHLRVCFKSADGRNCGHCAKCLLTMLTLETAVGLAACPTFPDRLDHRRLRALCIETAWERRHLNRLRQLAVEAGRSDVIGTVDYLLGWRGSLRCRARGIADRLFGARSLLRRAARRARRIAAPPERRDPEEGPLRAAGLRRRPPERS